MKRKESKKLTKHTMMLYEGQIDTLQEFHPRLGAAKVIRTLIDDHIRSVKEGVARKIDPPEPTKLKIEEILPTEEESFDVGHG